MAERAASARWTGDLKGGEGTMRLGSGAYEGSYSFRSRFEDGEGGTNPEELIGAAHAGCFSMALADELSQAGHTVDSVKTTAKVALGQKDGEAAITGITLTTKVSASGVDDDEFQKIADAAKQGCPVSKALAATEITLDAELTSG